MEHRITAAGPLLDASGRLREPGYALQPVSDYNPERLSLTPFKALNRLRLKEWDYYGVWCGDLFLSITISHIGYMGLMFAYIIDFKRDRMIEQAALTPLGRGVSLPTSSRAGDSEYVKGGLRVTFTKRPGERRAAFVWPKFDGQKTFRAELRFDEPETRDHIVMATPIGKNGFYYNDKIPGMPVTGTAQLDGWVDGPLDGALGVLDWGRGVWPYRSFWNWASAFSRRDDGRILSLNLGQGFGDLSAATENSLFLDGKLHKLGPVQFEYSPRDWLAPWRFTDREGRCKLTLRPIFDRSANTNLGVLKSAVHQVFGHFEGLLVTDDGECLDVSGLTGWAEEHQARW